MRRNFCSTNKSQAEKDIDFLIDLDTNNCVQVEGYPEDISVVEVEEYDETFLKNMAEKQKAKYVSFLLDTDY